MSRFDQIAILTLLILLEINNAFEISLSNDNIWSYINITCQKETMKHMTKIENKDLLNLYYEFGNSRKPRSIGNSAQSPFSKRILNKNLNGQELLKGNYGYSNDSSKDEIVRLKENTIKGSERVFLYTNCDLVDFPSATTSDEVKSLLINSDGYISLHGGWYGSNITVLKIFAKELHLSSNCSWLPNTVSQLDLSAVLDTDLSLCKSDLEILSLTETGLNSTNFCFRKLENLDLSSNNISFIEVPEECGNNIRELKASHNNIRHWSSCTFPKLVYLSLDHNFITTIDLSKCKSDDLFRFDISHNKLSQYPPSLPERLSIIDLSFNKITNVTTVENSLKIIDLSHNIIEHLMKGAFRFAWDLTELNLSHNLLSAIHGYDFSGLRLLTILDLSHNNIQHIRQNAFSTLLNLKTLHINGNKLHKLHARLLVSLPKKINFFAHGNPWSCSCYLLAELSKISRSTCMPNCQHQQNKLQCKQGKAWLPAPTMLKRCIKAVQSNMDAGFEYPPTPESDEDTSEIKQELSLVAVHSGLIIVFLLVIAAISTKLYTKRKWVRKHFCYCLEPSSLGTVKNGYCLTSVQSKCPPSSESETEL